MATLESRVTIGKEVLFQDLGGEAVLLNLESGKYYGLDEVGTRMWSLLIEHGQVKGAYTALLAEYDVSEERLEEDLLHFVDELVSHGLLQIDTA
ncbi:MAG: PqqD family protein [Chloroflexi bacterium]|nr:PqqD family protein [Chloroflexota bacterium]